MISWENDCLNAHADNKVASKLDMVTAASTRPATLISVERAVYGAAKLARTPNHVK